MALQTPGSARYSTDTSGIASSDVFSNEAERFERKWQVTYSQVKGANVGDFSHKWHRQAQKSLYRPMLRAIAPRDGTIVPVDGTKQHVTR